MPIVVCLLPKKNKKKLKGEGGGGGGCLVHKFFELISKMW